MTSLEHFHRRFATNGPSCLSEWILFSLLVPLGVLYGTVNWLRSTLYRLGFLQATSSSLPVISVGNIAVGGTGKTPFVDYLLSYFEERGFRPAVISRGYGGSFKGRLAVVSDGVGPVFNAEYCGDEPFLLAKKHPEALVAIAPRRRDAIEWIDQKKNADLIILDDAFQHQQVNRDLNIVLLDATKPLGNGYPLPAGLLREFPRALNRADLLVMTRAEMTDKATFKSDLPVIGCRHRLSDRLDSLDGTTLSSDSLKGKKGIAFAGIARPDVFFQALTEMGLNIAEAFPLADHERYDADVIQKLTASDNIDYFITTEKDAVKISATDLPCPCYIARLEIEITDGAELQNALSAVTERIKNAIG